MKIGIAGIDGRMGQEVRAAAHAAGHEVAIGLSRQERQDGVRRTADPAELAAAVEVVIDFTAPASAPAIAAACASVGTPLVLGVTGLTDEQWGGVETASQTIPVFYARNFSLGIAALVAALPAMVQALDGYDIEIVEAHHRYKADAPSGTALALAEAIAAARHADLSRELRYGRSGHAPRQDGEIAMHSIRAGGNAGEHSVIIASDGEEIRLQHRAYTRRTFAAGALRAARFIIDRPPGLYGMGDLVGLVR